MSEDNDDSSIGQGGLADKLEQLDIDATDRDVSSSDADADDDTSTPGQKARTPAEDPPQDQPPELSDEALFEQAIAEMSPEDARRAKNPPQERGERASRRVAETDQADTLSDVVASEERADEQSPDERTSRTPTEEELFEQAVSSLGPEDMYRGKFEGAARGVPAEEEEQTSESAPDAPVERPVDEASAESDVDEERAREALGEIRTKRQFEKAVGPVDEEVQRDKYRRRSAKRDPEKDVERRLAFRSDSPDELTTPPLPKSGDGLHHVGKLDPAHKDLLERFQKRARHQQVLEINVRGDTVEDALRQVELFVHQQWKERARFCRIVHGRGLRSKGDPVLKPAILRWLEGPGFRYIRGYAPETNNAGDYGSVVVELAERSEE